MKKLLTLLLILLSSVSLLACRKRANKQPFRANKIRIGILQYMEHNSLTEARRGFIEQLKTEGYKEGDNLKISYQNAQGDQSNLQVISEKLIEKNKLILAIATPAAQSLASLTSKTPILFTAVTDPLSADLVKSLKNPGGLVTGVSDQAPIAKQIDLLGQAVPHAKRVGLLYSSSERNSEIQIKQAQKQLLKAGYKVTKKTVTSTNDVQDAARSLMAKTDVIFVPTDNTLASTMPMLAELSLEKHVPIIGGSTDMVDAGGLLTYGCNYEQLGKQVAKQAVKILKGQDPARLPVQYPKQVDLHVNREMAKKLGIDLSKLSEEKK
ncbi:ABC transporter substrate-binding protein [Streptococcus catagoni]|uniref:ABC transporter substrate-binding protein n=1 Tax=Streptococcus catagoni TaxID=2654874 RepID=UPI0014085DF3|nr:ABC transporter substrate-binding protein [Streptococcus catagoni]